MPAAQFCLEGSHEVTEQEGGSGEWQASPPHCNPQEPTSHLHRQVGSDLGTAEKWRNTGFRTS